MIHEVDAVAEQLRSSSNNCVDCRHWYNSQMDGDIRVSLFLGGHKEAVRLDPDRDRLFLFLGGHQRIVLLDPDRLHSPIRYVSSNKTRPL
jgi:hypothetical protein